MTERGGLLPKSQNTALCISGRDILAFGSQSLNMSLCSFVVEYMYIYNLVDIQLSSVPWPTGSSGGHEGRFSRDPFPAFSAECPCEQFWHEQECPLFDVVHPAFPLPTTASPTLKGVQKDGFRETVVASDMPDPCKFPSLNSYQKRFLWSINEVILFRIQSLDA